MSEPQRRYRRIVIEDIFGPGSHTVDVPLRVEERVTVLHGRNGSGKTWTLKLISALRDGRYADLRRLPFGRMILETTDGARLTLTGGHQARAGRDKVAPMSYLLEGVEGGPEHGKLAKTARDSETGKGADRTEIVLRDYGFRHVGPDEFMSLDGDLVLSGEEAFALLGIESVQGPDPGEGSLLRPFRESLPPIKFVQTDRLHRWEPMSSRIGPRASARRQLMVEHLSQQIRGLVVEADAKYRKISTDKDGSLAKRLFEHPQIKPTRNELRDKSQALRDLETRLESLGLLTEPASVVDVSGLLDEQLGPFEIILSDREAKLEPFLPVVSRAERLLQSLNKKLAPKQVKLNVESGYQILTAAGTPLSLSSLSSGEQHELVLLHELLFEVTPGSLILIDEPELSLHVTWQAELIPDLLEIAKLSELDFVLATHSPFIIGDEPGRADLMVRLGEPV